MVDRFDHIRQNSDIKEFARKINKMQRQIRNIANKLAAIEATDLTQGFADTRQQSEIDSSRSSGGASGGSGSRTAVDMDKTAQFDDIANVTIAASDELLIEDNDDSQSKKAVLFSVLESTINHDNIAGVSAADHHSKYTDAEAISAVEGEGTLDVLHSDLVTVNAGDHHAKYTDSEAVDAIEAVVDLGAAPLASDDVIFNDGGVLKQTAFSDIDETTLTAIKSYVDGQTHEADTNLTQEEVQDFVGGMVTGNTETLISVTYQDPDGTLDFVVDEASIDHGSIAGLADDDHTQYILTDGTREFTGNVNLGGNDLILTDTANDGIYWNRSDDSTETAIYNDGSNGLVLKSTRGLGYIKLDVNDYVQLTGKIGFYGTSPVAQSSAYTITNVTTDRDYDASGPPSNQVLADTLGTLIADLQATGLIG